MKNGTGWICVLASKNMFRRVLEQIMKCFRAASTKKNCPNEPPAVAQEPFTDLWHCETQIRRDALAPSWNQHTRRVVHKKQWPAIFRSWDRVNQNLHSATQAHLRKLHAMRLTTQSVFTPGCWVYALWHLADGRVYVGQTGGRANPRSVAERGREHVRLATDFLRLYNGRRLWLPQSVYRWMMQRGRLSPL